MADDFMQLWAKTSPDDDQSWHPLWCHMLDVAAVAGQLHPRFGPIGDIPLPWVAYLAALHDIGKADWQFQRKSEPQARRLREAGLPFGELFASGFRHERLSAEWVRGHLVDQHGWRNRAAEVVAAALRSHHGDPAPESSGEDDSADRAAVWHALRSYAARAVWDELAPPAYAPRRFADAGRTGLLLTGTIVLADWIASNPDLYDYDALRAEAAGGGALAYLTAARVRAARVVDQLGLARTPVPPVPGRRFAEVWPGLATPRPVQQLVDDLCRDGLPPGLVIIESEMGSGKTEVAYYLVDHWNRTAGRSGAYLALPTMATSNQMHQRYRDWLEAEGSADGAPRLIHGQAWMVEDDAPARSAQTWSEDRVLELDTDWFRNARRAMIAPEGVGTVDQALSSVLNIRFGFLRLLGMAPRTLVIDEVHAYDAYMTTILEMLMAWCSALRVPVVLLSATLTHQQKERLTRAYHGVDTRLPHAADYPLVTACAPGADPVVRSAPASGATRSVRLYRHPGLLSDPAATARLCLDLVRDGGCLCLICNTVRDAQAIFAAIDREPFDGERILFHARFPAARRTGLENRVVRLFGKGAGAERPRRAIVVATQVVEQSLDLDFDVMVTQLAPADLLLQRTGRLHRHTGIDRRGHGTPSLHLLLPPADSLSLGLSGRVYAHYPLLRTLVLVQGRESIELPMDIRSLVESCYDGSDLGVDATLDEAIAAARDALEAKQANARGKASIHLVPPPDQDDFTLGRMGMPKWESDETGGPSYLHAQTRMTDDTRESLAILCLDVDSPGLPGNSTPPPGRAALRALYQHYATVPAYWIPGEDLAALKAAAPRWLRGVVVLPLRDRSWVSADGTRCITDHPRLGLMLGGAVPATGLPDAPWAAPAMPTGDS